MLYSKVSKGSGRSPVVGQLPSKVKPKVNELDKEEVEVILPVKQVSLLGTGLSRDMVVQSCSGHVLFVELLEFLPFIESDVMGEFNVANDSARPFL